MPARPRAVPGLPAPSLRARLGETPLREHAGLRYLPLRSRSLMGRCSSERMPFEWTVNPYRGCAMGCRYCYAAYTHEFVGRSAAAEFHSIIYVKQDAWDETARALRAAARRGQRVALGTATDPYQPGESEWRVTRRFLELAAAVPGLRLGLTTKGAGVLRDLDLLAQVHRRGRLRLHVSLISPRAELLRRLEPWAPPPAVRLEVLRRLREEGLDAWLSIAPVLPGISDREQDLAALLRAARAAGVSHARFNLLFLRSPTREIYLDFVAREFPALLPAYRRAYQGRVYLGGDYPARLRARLRALIAAAGLQGDDEARAEGEAGPAWVAEQLGLWERV